MELFEWKRLKFGNIIKLIFTIALMVIIALNYQTVMGTFEEEKMGITIKFIFSALTGIWIFTIMYGAIREMNGYQGVYLWLSVFFHFCWFVMLLNRYNND